MSEHGPCDLVVEHNKVLGGIQADISYIKSKIDNGLSEKLADVEAKFDTFSQDSWVMKLLSGGIKKFFALLIFVILITAATNTGMWAYFKTYTFKEIPGQQQAIHNLSVNGTYHLHTLPDGKIIFHGNAPDKPAWVLDPITKQWQRCPQYRTDETIGVSVK